MSSLKTKISDKNVEEYINSIANNSKQENSKFLLSIMKEITAWEPKIWGGNIIGFGNYKYKRKGGKEEYEWFNLGFAVRKTKLTIYISQDVSIHSDLLEKLGKHKIGKGCLYINKLQDVDLDVLKQIIERSKNARWHSGN